MKLFADGFQHNLRHGFYEFWRVVEPGAHLELSDAELLRLLAGLMIDLTQGLDVVGDEGYWYDTHFAHTFYLQLAQRLVQGRL